MDKKEIINYIRQNNSLEIADLQHKFSLSYREVKGLIDELLADGKLVFDSGRKYSYIRNIDDKIDERMEELKKSRADSQSKAHDSGDEDEEEKEELRKNAERYRYLEARRQELIRRMQAETEEDEEDEDEDDDDEYEIDWDVIYYKAMKLCIDKGEASVSLLQHSLPIGYIKACKIIDWMEHFGYISEPTGSKPRKVLITQEELKGIFGEAAINFYENGDEPPCDKKIEALYDKADEKDSKKGDIVPAHPDWKNEEEFKTVVMRRMVRLIQSDTKMGLQGAIKKAEAYLDAVKDTSDEAMIQVYERLVYEIRHTSNYLYKKLKKQLN